MFAFFFPFLHLQVSYFSRLFSKPFYCTLNEIVSQLSLNFGFSDLSEVMMKKRKMRRMRRTPVRMRKKKNLHLHQVQDCCNYANGIYSK